MGVAVLPSRTVLECDGCGSRALCGVIGDAIVSFPPGTPYQGCGSHDLPLVFRAWVRRTAFLIGSHELTPPGICHGCANRSDHDRACLDGAARLVVNYLILVPRPESDLLQLGRRLPRPVTPLAWGAVHVADVIDDLRGDREYDATMAALHDSPFNALSDKQSELVYDAEGLYECLRVPWNATSGDLRRAYTARARAVHPDVRPSDRSANDEMIQLNRAWEILRDPQIESCLRLARSKSHAGGGMTRVLLFAALAVSLVVPVGSVALAATSSGSSTDQEAIEMPTTPTANPITPPTSIPAGQSTSPRPNRPCTDARAGQPCPFSRLELNPLSCSMVDASRCLTPAVSHEMLMVTRATQSQPRKTFRLSSRGCSTQSETSSLS